MPTQEISELLADELYEQAMLEAAETVGPNSYEYDDLVESIYERLCCAQPQAHEYMGLASHLFRH